MKKKLISVILVTLLALTISVAPVLATTSFNMALSANSTRVAQGSEVVVTVNLRDFTAGETGINALHFTLDYDEAIFETLTQNSFSGENGWGAPTYNPANSEGAMDSNGFKAENHDMLKVTLKVKENAAVGSTTITMKNVSASDGNNEIRPSDKSITLTITKKDEAPQNTTEQPKNEAPKNVNVNAGLEDLGSASVIVPAIVVFALVGIMAYVRYTRIDK